MGEDFYARGKRGDWPLGSDRSGFIGGRGRFGGQGRFDHHAGPPRDLGPDRPPRPFFGAGRGPHLPPGARREGIDRVPGLFPPGVNDWQRPPPLGPLGPDSWQHYGSSRGGREPAFGGRMASPPDGSGRKGDGDKAAEIRSREHDREREQREKDRDRDRRSGVGRGTSMHARGSSSVSALSGRAASSDREGDPTPAVGGRDREAIPALGGRGDRDWASPGGFTSPEHADRAAPDVRGAMRVTSRGATSGADGRDGRAGPGHGPWVMSADKEFGPRGARDLSGDSRGDTADNSSATAGLEARDNSFGHDRNGLHRQTVGARDGDREKHHAPGVSSSSRQRGEKESRDGSSSRQRAADKDTREASTGSRQRSSRDRSDGHKDRPTSRERARQAVDPSAACGAGLAAGASSGSRRTDRMLDHAGDQQQWKSPQHRPATGEGAYQAVGQLPPPPASGWPASTAAGLHRGKEELSTQHAQRQHASSGRQHRKREREQDKGKDGSSSKSRRHHGSSRSRSERHAELQQRELGKKQQRQDLASENPQQQPASDNHQQQQQQHESEDMEAGEVPPSEEAVEPPDVERQQQEQDSSRHEGVAPDAVTLAGSPISFPDVPSGAEDHLYSPPTEQDLEEAAGAPAASPAAAVLPEALDSTDEPTSLGAHRKRQLLVAEGESVLVGAPVSAAALAAAEPVGPTADDSQHLQQQLSAEVQGGHVHQTDAVGGMPQPAVVQELSAAGAAVEEEEENDTLLCPPAAAMAAGKALQQQQPEESDGTQQQQAAAAGSALDAAAPIEEGPAPKRRRLGFGMGLARLGKAPVGVTGDSASLAPAAVAEGPEVDQPADDSQVPVTGQTQTCEAPDTHTQPVTEPDECAEIMQPAAEAEAAAIAEGSEQCKPQLEEQHQEHGPLEGEQQQHEVAKMEEQQQHAERCQPSKAEISKALQQLEDETGDLEQQIQDLCAVTDVLTTQLAALDQELVQISDRDLAGEARQQLAVALQVQQQQEEAERELRQQQQEQEKRERQQQQEIEDQAAAEAVAEAAATSPPEAAASLPDLQHQSSEVGGACVQQAPQPHVELGLCMEEPWQYRGPYVPSAFGSSKVQERLWKLPPSDTQVQQAILQHNRQSASSARIDLIKLLPGIIQEEAEQQLAAAQPLRKRYECVQDLQDVWQQLQQEHEDDGGAIARFLAQRRALLQHKHNLQAERYKAGMVEFQAYLKGEQEAAAAAPPSAAAIGSAWGQGRQQSGGLGGGRSTRASAAAAGVGGHGPYQPDIVKSVYEEERLMQVFRAVEDLRRMSLLPHQLQDPWQRRWQGFASDNGLVEDPVQELQEDKMGLDWSEEERKIFMERFLQFPKDFRKIATFLELRTPAECVVFFYKHQKLDEFAHVRRKQQLKKRRQTAETKRMWAISARPMAITAMREAAEQREQRRENREREREAAAAAAAAAGRGERDGGAAGELAGGIGGNGLTAAAAAAVAVSGRAASRGARPRGRGGRGRGRAAAAAAVVVPNGDDDDDADYNPFVDPAHPGTPMSGVMGRRTSNEDGTGSEPGATSVPDEVFIQAVFQHGRNMTAISNYVTAVGYPKNHNYCKWFFGRHKKRLNLDDVADRGLAQRRAARGAAAAAAAGDDADMQTFATAVAATAMQQHYLHDPAMAAAAAAAMQQHYAGLTDPAAAAAATAAGFEQLGGTNTAAVMGLEHVLQLAAAAPVMAAAAADPAVAAASEVAPSASGYGDGYPEQADDEDATSAAAAAAAGGKRASTTWTDVERDLFLQHFKQEGKSWDRIAQLMPSKTANQIKSYYSNNRRKLDLDSLIPAAAAPSKAARGRSRANSIMAGDLAVWQQQHLLHGGGSSGEHANEGSMLLLPTAAVQGHAAAALMGEAYWQQMHGPDRGVNGAAAPGVVDEPTANRLLALLHKNQLLAAQGVADAGTAHLAALAAAAATSSEFPSADASSLSAHVGALPGFSDHTAAAAASPADILSSIAKEHLHLHLHHHQQQQQQPQNDLLMQALLQLQTSAPAAPAAAASSLLAGASNALPAPELTAPGIMAAGLQAQADLSNAPPVLANLLGASAAGDTHGVTAGVPAADVAQLCQAHMRQLAAPVGNGVAQAFLARLTAAAEAQQQQQQQAAAVLHLKQLLGDAGYHQPAAALMQGQQEQHPAAAIIAVAAAAHDCSRPCANAGAHEHAAGAIEARSEAPDVDPLKALQQTLSSLKADLGLETLTPRAAPAVASSGDGELAGTDPPAQAAAAADASAVPGPSAGHHELPQQPASAVAAVSEDGALGDHAVHQISAGQAVLADSPN